MRFDGEEARHGVDLRVFIFNVVPSRTQGPLHPFDSSRSRRGVFKNLRGVDATLSEGRRDVEKGDS
jgi:hypothetical protein